MRLLSIAAAIIAAFTLSAAAETIRSTQGGTPIEITLSDGLSAYPLFRTFLRSDAEAAASDLAAEGARRVSVSDEAVFARGRFASVRREITADLGGAQPYRQIEGLTWDRDAQDFVRLDAFFDAGQQRDDALIAISHHLRETIKLRVWGGGVAGPYQPLVLQATNPDAAVLSNFTLSRGGLAFHYSPREIAPLSRGAPTVTTPLSIFSAFLNAEGRAAFR